MRKKIYDKLLKNKTILGFTMIELLVVVSIIGILTTLVLANLNAARERARDSQRKSDLYNLRTALRLYYNDLGRYPRNSVNATIEGCGDLGDSECVWGEEWSVDGNVFMGKLPKDPLDTQSYQYIVDDDFEAYTLKVCLENKSDDKGIALPEGSPDLAWCPGGLTYQLRP